MSTSKTAPGTLSGALWVAAFAILFTAPAFAQPCDPVTPTNLCFHDLTAPNIIGDSNLNGQPEDGPRAFTIAARVCNFTGGPLTNLFVNVGDGATPGTFPVATVPGSAPYLDDNYRLELLPGATGQRFEGTQSLADGECLPFYFPVQYRVVDPNGDALWGKSNTTADDLPLQFSIWGSATDAGNATVNAAQLDDTVTIRNEITANPNKVQPNPLGETYYSLSFPTVAATRAGVPWDPDGANTPPAGATLLTTLPPPIAPGETITIYFRNPTFGNPNQGFDVGPPAGPDTDLWFQPIGETYWDPSAFRLVKVQSFLRGTGCNAAMEPAGERFYYVDDVAGGFYMINGGAFETSPAFLPGMEHMGNQTWYARELQLHDCNAWDAEWYGYTFIALDAGKSRISPYQEVASGSDNEKYNGDYCGDLFSAGPDLDTPHLICVPLTAAGTPELDLVKTVDKTADTAGGTLTYSVDVTNVGTASVGSATSGIQVVDQVPTNTTYVAASATCSLGSCAIGYSTDGGMTFSSIEPVPASVTHLRWAFNQTLSPAAAGTVGFQVVIDSPFPGGSGTVTNTAQLRIDNGPFLLTDDAETTIDLGQIRVHLFFDADGNMVQGAGEPDLAGVDVEITENGGGMQTITSDANGDVFATVPAGSTGLAVVAATVPAGYMLTTGNDPQAGIVVSAGATASGTDIGYNVAMPMGAIGDFVWEDLNANGMQDDGATGIDGVTVELVSAGCTFMVDCPTTTTAGGGLYSFTGLPADTYLVYVDETSIPGFPAPVRTTPDNPITIVLGPDEVNNTADFGYESPVGGVIGDRVWADQNDDGVQDPGEPGLGGIQLELQDGVCTPGADCPTTTTSNGGVYLFNDLPPGTYTVVVLAPLPGPAGAFPPAQPVMLAQSQVNLDVDFPFVVPNADIGDFVWNDLNGDGVQDVGEAGIDGVIVELLFAEDTTAPNPVGGGGCTAGLNCPDCIPAAGLPVLPTALPNCPAVATAGGGAYLFANFPPRTYQVVVHETSPPVSGLNQTTPGAVTVPLSGIDVLSADFGFAAPSGTVTKHVFQDTNGNGVQDVGEPDLAGVEVAVTDSGMAVQMANTNATGDVSFTVPVGAFTCDVNDMTLPPGYVLTTGNDPHGGNVTDGGTVGGSVGYQPRGTLTKHVYEDTNGNGVQDVGEPDLAGVTVNVTDSLGVMQSAATNATGDVSFSVAAGMATCDVDDTTLPTGYVLTTGNDPHSPNVPPGGSAGGNVGYQPGGGTVTAHVFEDTNGNGVQDVGEPDLPGVDVTVTDSLGGMLTGTTNATGDVSAGVPAGNTSCDVVDATVPAGYVLTTANDPPGGPGQVIVAVTGTTVAFADYGYQPRGTLTKHVYEDTNSNGVQDVGEPDLAGVTVNVTDSLGAMHSAATNATGDVSFDVPAGLANCDVDDTTLPPGLVLTTGNDPHSGNVPAGGTVSADVGYGPPINPAIGVAKQVLGAVLPGPGANEFDVTFELTVENLGNVALSSVQVSDDLTVTFPAPVTFAVLAAPATTGTLAANAGFDGAGDPNLLNAAGSTLSLGATGTITFTVRITVASLPAGPFFNVAFASGLPPSGPAVGDTSDDGSDPDPDGSGDGGGPGEDDPTQIVIPAVSAPVPIPTVSEWGMLLLTLLLASGGLVFLRRRRV